MEAAYSSNTKRLTKPLYSVALLPCHATTLSSCSRIPFNLVLLLDFANMSLVFYLISLNLLHSSYQQYQEAYSRMLIT